MKKTVLLIVGIAVGMNTSIALAHESMPGGHASSDALTPDLKKDMADMYQKMADCLRTDKSLEQCSREAKMNCPVVQKTGHCPINEGMGQRTKHQEGAMGSGNMKDDHHNKSPGDHAKHDKAPTDSDSNKK